MTADRKAASDLDTIRQELDAYAALFDEAVERWHMGNDDRPIEEVLGITFEQYAAIVEHRADAAVSRLQEGVWLSEEDAAKIAGLLRGVTTELSVEVGMGRYEALALLAGKDTTQ